MAAAKSAGILLYKVVQTRLLVLLAHPGGPFYAKKDDGSWTIPKGEFTVEDPLQAAIREFTEETGIVIDGGANVLTPVKIKSGKIIYPFAIEADVDVTKAVSNHFEMEWPPRSGQMKSFPEIDRIEWFEISDARSRIHQGQLPILNELEHKLSKNS